MAALKTDLTDIIVGVVVPGTDPTGARPSTPSARLSKIFLLLINCYTEFMCMGEKSWVHCYSRESLGKRDRLSRTEGDLL